MINRRKFSIASGLAAALALSAGAFFTAAPADAEANMTAPTIGELAPQFTGMDSNGEGVSLSDFAGQTVVLEWTNDGCPFVQKHYAEPIKNIQTMQASAAADDVVWVSIISSAPGKQGHVSGEEANTLSATRGATPAHVLIDETGEIGRLYNARTTPHMYVIDGDQRLAYQGAIDSKPSTRASHIAGATNYVTEALASLAAGEAIAVTDTQAYGCSVKYG